MSIPEPAAPQQSTEYPFWNYHDLVLFVAMALPSLLAGALLVHFLGYLSPSFLRAKGPQALVGQFLGYGFLFGCLYLLLKTKYNRPFWSSLAWTFPWRGMPWMILAGPALAFGIAILGVAMHTPEVETPFKQFLNDRVSVILLGAFASTLGPLCEELAFRGFLMPLLTRSFGAAPAIVLTALPFALLHGQQYSWSWRHILLILLAGSVFGIVRHRTGSTAAATLIHGTYNLTQFSAFLIQERLI